MTSIQRRDNATCFTSSKIVTHFFLDFSRSRRTVLSAAAGTTGRRAHRSGAYAGRGRFILSSFDADVRTRASKDAG